MIIIPNINTKYMLCLPDPFAGNKITSVYNLDNGLCIPFDPTNMQYEQFKIDVMNGAVLKNSDGSIMNSQESISYVELLG
jgi:hypothetical protein